MICAISCYFYFYFIFVLPMHAVNMCLYVYEFSLRIYVYICSEGLICVVYVITLRCAILAYDLLCTR